MTAPQLDLEASGDIVTATLRGDIDLATAPQIAHQVFEVITNDTVGLVVDLSAVRYLDSCGVHMLLQFARRLEACRQLMGLALGQDSPLRTLVKITHLDEAVPIHSSPELSIIALRERTDST